MAGPSTAAGPQGEGRAGDRVLGVLLAAGSGSRFAGNSHKLLAPHRGRPLVTHALDAMLEAGFEHNLVVTGAVDLDGVIPSGAGNLTVIVNPRWAEGQATSLRVAADWAAGQGFDALVVGLGDQPGIPASAWRAVGAADSPIVVARYRVPGRNPVRLSRAVWDLLPDEGDFGARHLIRRRPDLVAQVPCEGHPFDIDTVEDLRHAADQ